MKKTASSNKAAGMSDAAVQKRTGKTWSQWFAILDASSARGMRQVHETPEGYAALRSKTYGVPLARLYAAWKDEKARRRWLKGGKLDVSSASPNRAIRGRWDGGASRVDVMFYPKGAGKSQVAVDHRRLTSQKDVARMKTYWGEQLDRLSSLLGT